MNSLKKAFRLIPPQVFIITAAVLFVLSFWYGGKILGLTPFGFTRELFVLVLLVVASFIGAAVAGFFILLPFFLFLEKADPAWSVWRGTCQLVPLLFVVGHLYASFSLVELKHEFRETALAQHPNTYHLTASLSRQPPRFIGTILEDKNCWLVSHGYLPVSRGWEVNGDFPPNLGDGYVYVTRSALEWWDENTTFDLSKYCTSQGT